MCVCVCEREREEGGRKGERERPIGEVGCDLCVRV